MVTIQKYTKVFVGGICLFIVTVILQFAASAADESITKNINTAVANPILDYCAIAISLCGAWLFWVITALVIYIVYQKQDGAKKAFFILLALITTTLIVLCIKPLIMRPRPDFEGIRILIGSEFYSFPSGHTARAVATLIGLWYIGLNIRTSKLFLCNLVLAILTAYSRLLVGAHFMLDVLGGVFAGVFCTALLIIILNCKVVKKYIDEKLKI